MPVRPLRVHPVPAPPLAGRLLLGAWLLVVWLALWGTLTTANVLSGVAVATLVQLVPLPGRPVRPVVRPLAALRFAAWFAWSLVRACVVVAVEVATPRNRIATGVVAVPLRETTSDALLTLVAATVTLTPGTLTLEARRDPPTLYVHVLHLRDADAVRATVRRAEHLALRAFGPRDAATRPDPDRAAGAGDARGP